MNLYEKCLSLTKTIHSPFDGFQGKDLINDDYSFQKYEAYKCLSVYYISDIHLEHRIINRFPHGASDSEIDNYLLEIVKQLLIDDIVFNHRQWNPGIILFGGDIASSLELSTRFYELFVSLWDQYNHEEYNKKREPLLPLIQEQGELRKIIIDWMNQHEWIKTAKKDWLEYSDKRIPQKIKENVKRGREINTIINTELGINKAYYLNPWKPPIKKIYSILGNHELWDFNSYENCIQAYRTLFNRLGITFLNNDSEYIIHETPRMRLDDDKIVEVKKEDNPEQYEKYSAYVQNIAIIGGIGFAGYNEMFNAKNGIYRDVINREQEIQHTKKWENYYSESVKKAHEEHDLLLILTHNPFGDWSDKKQVNSNCIYFSGHNHLNTVYNRDDINSFIYANNQIGYDNNIVKFKNVLIYKRTNPFADYDDGCFTISSTDYERFNSYSGIHIQGTRVIDKYTKDNFRLYMIKNKGYYGFFIAKKNEDLSTCYDKIYICAGGCIKRISSHSNIDYYKKNFPLIIKKYLEILSPYRNAQEQLSKYIKSFGGDGYIHGCIVDIDWNNHIMINPNDGTITFYYSPFFGCMKPYSTLDNLLAEHNPILYEKYLEKKSQLVLLPVNQISVDRMIKLDIKNSLYAVSSKLNQLQRLFNAKILRDWNDKLLDTNQANNDSVKLLN